MCIYFLDKKIVKMGSYRCGKDNVYRTGQGCAATRPRRDRTGRYVLFTSDYYNSLAAQVQAHERLGYTTFELQKIQGG